MKLNTKEMKQKQHKQFYKDFNSATMFQQVSEIPKLNASLQ